MRTVGQILKEEREKKYYSLDEIERVTKIRKELLEALEKDDYNRLPPPTFIQGFIKNYGRFLGLDVEKLLAVFRREFSDRKNPPKIMKAWIEPLDRKRLHITPTRTLSAFVIGLLLTFFFYLWIEYRFLVGAPYLEVTQPTDKTTVSIDNIKVLGKTNPEAEVSINDQKVMVDISGNFSQDIRLTDSVNIIKISSTSKSGKVSSLEKTVYFKK